MGYACALRHACAVAAVAGLTACNPPARQSETAELRNDLHALSVRVEILEADNLVLKAQISSTRALAIANAEGAKSLSETVSTNAKIANENALKDMTRRGACGTRMVPVFATNDPTRQIGIKNEVIPCTLEDLKP